MFHVLGSMIRTSAVRIRFSDSPIRLAFVMQNRHVDTVLFSFRENRLRWSCRFEFSIKKCTLICVLVAQSFVVG